MKAKKGAREGREAQIHFYTHILHLKKVYKSMLTSFIHLFSLKKHKTELNCDKFSIEMWSW